MTKDEMEKLSAYNKGDLIVALTTIGALFHVLLSGFVGGERVADQCSTLVVAACENILEDKTA